MNTIKSALIASGIVCLLCAAASAQQRDTRIELQPGESPQAAMYRNRIEERSAELRAAWIAAGKPISNSAPVVTSGKLLTTSIKTTVAPAAPRLSVAFQASAGLSYIGAAFRSNSSGQVVYAEYDTPYHGPGPKSGTVTIEQSGGQDSFYYLIGHLSLYSATGTWTLTNLTIEDLSGGQMQYGGSQLATLFGGAITLTVTNPASPDTTAPLVTAGKILTPTVHIGSTTPSFGASLTVSDNLSGALEFCVYIAPPGSSSGSCYDNHSAAPVVSGTFNTWNYIGASGTKGTWTITGYGVCDVATNCFYDNNAADVKALFGTNTFAVAN